MLENMFIRHLKTQIMNHVTLGVILYDVAKVFIFRVVRVNIMSGKL